MGTRSSNRLELGAQLKMPDFPLWPQCNIGCVFCSNPVEGFRHTTEQYSFDEIKKKLAGYKRGLRTFVKFDEVRDYFNLTGGEPTIHPDFLKILALIRLEFPNILIRLLSNGRMFYYIDFAQKTLRIGKTPFEIAIPLFGHDSKTHQSISRTPQSFEQTTAGLRHLRTHKIPGQKIEIRIILTKIQCKRLEKLIEYLLSEFSWVDRVVFLYQEIEGFAEHYKEVLKIPMSEAASHLDRHYEILKKFKEVRLYHFPLCVVPTRLWPWVWNTLADFKVTYLESCQSRCLYKNQCVGIHRSYLRHSVASDISPITSPKPVQIGKNPYHPIKGSSL